MHDGLFSRFSKEEGLPDNEIAVILDDTLDHRWLGSNHGVFRVARDELRAVAQGRKKRLEGITYLGGDGLASAQIAGGHNAGLRSQDGRLWFATSRGVSVVDPGQIRVNPLPPPVEIEEALADGTILHSGGRDGIDRAFIIPPGTARTEFHYTALSFTNPDRNQFRFWLEGYDADWSEVSTRRMASYSKVTPGTYRFRVLAANSDGIWNETGASVSVTFLPMWWQTWTFRIAAGFLPVASLLGANHRRVRGLKRARAQQEEFSGRLLAAQEVERARVARELHDSLGQNLLVIKSRVALAQQQSHQPIKLAEQLAEAAAMTSDAIREVREISQNLRPFQIDELGLTKALAAMVRKLGSASSIQFHCELVELRGALSPEHEINFYRIAQECLNNVVKHSDARHCSLTVTRSDRVVRLLITDDGRGFSMSTLPTVGKPQSGFGLTSIQERARTMSAEVEFVTRHGQGTRVTVTIPL
jgi:signal transduction histidine kinase